MEIRQLRYFVAVAEELHFGRAAQRLHIAQPAVSQQIGRLERELGLALFDRSPRHVRLTDAGARMLAEARAVLAATDGAAAVAAELAGPRPATLRLGTSPGLGTRVAAVMDRLGASGIAVELDARPVAAQLAAVRSGELDAALVRVGAPRPGLRAVRLWSEPLRAALPAAHPLAGRDRVRLDELADLPARIPDPACDPLLRDAVLDAFRAAGLAPRLGRQSTTVEDTLLEIGLAGTGWMPVWAEPGPGPSCGHPQVRVVALDPEIETCGALMVPAGRAGAGARRLEAAFAQRA